jgi:hypothetical protein
MWSVIESADSQRFVWCQLVLGTVKTPCSIVTRDPAAAATDAQSAITRHVPPTIFEIVMCRNIDESRRFILLTSTSILYEIGSAGTLTFSGTGPPNHQPTNHLRKATNLTSDHDFCSAASLSFSTLHA